MSLPSILRRQQPLRSLALLRRPFRLPQQKRDIHQVPLLAHGDTFKHNGVGRAFSPKAFRTAWTDYQEGLTGRLNELVANTSYENNTAQEIALLTSRQSDLAATFNYASQAHNNHFFFEALSPKETSIPDDFMRYIPDTFGSTSALKAELLSTAAAMFGAGWVWLVIDQNRLLRVLCTYNAGTPYGAAHRRQQTDMNTGETLGTGSAGAAGVAGVAGGVGGTQTLPSGGELTEMTLRATRGYGSGGVTPLLNINCWQHAWIEDWGVNGKRGYLEEVWKQINWQTVYNRCPTSATKGRQLFHE